MRLTFTQLMTLTLVGTSIFTGACSKHSNDNDIAQQVQGQVASDPGTKNSAVSISVKDGQVNLRGTVKDAATQQRLEQIAKSDGATNVNDETAVVPTSAPAAPSVVANAAPVGNTVNQPAAPVAPPQPIVVPAGTTLTVRVGETLSSKRSRDGQAFLATLAQPVTIEGTSVLPTGSRATGTVISARERGKIKGEGEIVLALTSITVNGNNYPIQTDTYDSVIKGKGKRTAVTTGGGAAGGALIGGLAGGGKGAGIGALIGAGGGLAGGAFTGNKQVEIPVESALTFTLTQSLTIPHSSN